MLRLHSPPPQAVFIPACPIAAPCPRRRTSLPEASNFRQRPTADCTTRPWGGPNDAPAALLRGSGAHTSGAQVPSPTAPSLRHAPTPDLHTTLTTCAKFRPSRWSAMRPSHSARGCESLPAHRCERGPAPAANSLASQRSSTQEARQWLRPRLLGAVRRISPQRPRRGAAPRERGCAAAPRHPGTCGLATAATHPTVSIWGLRWRRQGAQSNALT